MNDALAREYFRLARRSLYRYRSHCQYDDLEGHVLLRVFDYLGRLPEERLPTAAPLVVYWARLAAKEWMVSPECDTRPHTRDGAPLPVRISLAAAPAWLAVEPDFAPALIERLWREWLWESVWPALAPEEREALTAHLCEDWSCQRIGAARGWSTTKAWRRLQEGLNRYRLACGLPERITQNRHAHGARRRQQPGGGGSRDHPEGSRGKDDLGAIRSREED